MVKCMPGFACLDLENFKHLINNSNNTEVYIQQLENLLKELADPIEMESHGN
jgi:hypothetical protein